MVTNLLGGTLKERLGGHFAAERLGCVVWGEEGLDGSGEVRVCRFHAARVTTTRKRRQRRSERRRSR